MIAVFSAFVIGLVVAGIVCLAFKRSRWQWFHVLNMTPPVVTFWIVFSLLIAEKMASLQGGT
jgi:hypothetical protein